MSSSYVLCVSFRLVLVWLPFLLCHHMCIVVAQRHTYYSQRHYNADSINCQNVTEIVFLSFFPCLRQNGSGFEASKSISGCDLLAEAGAHLAVERVNQDPDVLPNITLKLYPIYVPNNGSNSLTVSHCWCNTVPLTVCHCKLQCSTMPCCETL